MNPLPRIDLNVVRRINVLAFLIADHVYCDQGSNKYIIAGTFHQLNISAFPAVFHKTIGVFIKLAGFAGSTGLGIVFEELATGEVMLRTQALEISNEDPDLPVELALEVPPLPLPRPGRYAFKLLAEGHVIGTAAVDVRQLAVAEPGR
jgi:hypothetical protein